MKKRHQQKLIIIALALAVFLNLPILLIFNVDQAIFGMPILYVAIFVIWFISIIISFSILKRHNE